MTEDNDGSSNGRADGVQSIVRAFGLLETMADHEGPIGLSQLATESGLPLATIHRLVRMLVGLGYVRQESTRQYALGPRLMRLGESSSPIWRSEHALTCPADLGYAVEEGEQEVGVRCVSVAVPDTTTRLCDLRAGTCGSHDRGTRGACGVTAAPGGEAPLHGGSLTDLVRGVAAARRSPAGVLEDSGDHGISTRIAGIVKIAYSIC